MSWGQNAYKFIHDIIWWLGLAVTAVFVVKFISKRQFLQLLGFVILAAIVLVIIDDPARLKAIGVTMWTAIFK